MILLTAHLPSHKDEDAPPLAAPGLCCVCDGLGSTGAQIALIEGGHQRTHAYMASRYLRGHVEDFWLSGEDGLKRLYANAGQEANTLSAEAGHFGQWLHEQMRKDEQALPGDIPQDFTGGLYANLPTTLAMLVCNPAIGDSPGGEIAMALWVGDSRCYLLDARGLHQLSKDDDVSPELDEWQGQQISLPITNVVSPAGFRVNYRLVELSGPCVLFAATDGVYSCVNSPLHVEEMVLEAIQSANSAEGFQEALTKALARKPIDDSAFAALAPGFADYVAMKAALEKRYDEIRALCEAWDRPPLDEEEAEAARELDRGWAELAGPGFALSRGILRQLAESTLTDMDFDILNAWPNIKSLAEPQAKLAECEKLHLEQSGLMKEREQVRESFRSTLASAWPRLVRKRMRFLPRNPEVEREYRDSMASCRLQGKGIKQEYKRSRRAVRSYRGLIRNHVNLMRSLKRDYLKKAGMPRVPDDFKDRYRVLGESMARQQAELANCHGVLDKWNALSSEFKESRDRLRERSAEAIGKAADAVVNHQFSSWAFLRVEMKMNEKELRAWYGALRTLKRNDRKAKAVKEELETAKTAALQSLEQTLDQVQPDAFVRELSECWAQGVSPVWQEAAGLDSHLLDRMRELDRLEREKISAIGPERLARWRGRLWAEYYPGYNTLREQAQDTP